MELNKPINLNSFMLELSRLDHVQLADEVAGKLWCALGGADLRATNQLVVRTADHLVVPNRGSFFFWSRRRARRVAVCVDGW